MPDDITVRVEGVRELRAALRRAGHDLTDLKEANQAVAESVARTAAARAPRRSGRLASSIKGNKSASKASIKAGSARVPYAQPIHWGWGRRNIKANPFVSKAATDTESVWKHEYEKAVEEIARKFNN